MSQSLRWLVTSGKSVVGIASETENSRSTIPAPMEGGRYAKVYSKSDLCHGFWWGLRSGSGAPATTVHLVVAASDGVLGAPTAAVLLRTPVRDLAPTPGGAWPRWIQGPSSC